MKILCRSLFLFLCVVVFASMIPSGEITAAADQPLTKTVSVTVKLSGVHTAADFAATQSFDDGQYTGTLTRQDNTLKSVVRAMPTITYSYQSDIKYPNDKSAGSQYSFPATYSTSYFDSASGQYFPVTLSRSGSPYFSGTATLTTLYWTHYGYEYDPINHTKLGYMSNNTKTYYSGLYRFSDPPKQPATYYGPPDEEGLGWVQYGAPVWDGELQDAEQEPWRSICIANHGVARFYSVTGGTPNRYRKPVRIYYRRTASCQYIYQNYTGTAAVTDTEITYTGTVSLKLPDLTVTSVTANKSTYEAGDTVTVTAVVKNQGAASAGNAVIRLTTSDGDTQDKTVSLAAGTSETIMYTFTAPTGFSARDITLTVTADPGNAIPESDETNNSRSAAISIGAVKPDITVTDANITNWYAGMDVIVSATVQNLSAQPVPSVDIRLTLNGVTYTESIPVPGNGSNLAVFRIGIPELPEDAESMLVTVVITADPGNTVSESDEENNAWTETQTIYAVPISTVVDPDSEAPEQEYIANGKAVASLPSVTSSAYHTWQEVRLENGSYVVRDFWARLETVFTISPDSRIADTDYPDIMESGFGVEIACRTVLTTNYDHSEKLVEPQIVWVYYPETAYGEGMFSGIRDLLAVLSGSAGRLDTLWQLAVNPYSVAGQRLHYTPIWFPDEEYIALAQAFYAWSPTGQMADYQADSVTIEGDMYDRVAVVRR